MISFDPFSWPAEAVADLKLYINNGVSASVCANLISSKFGETVSRSAVQGKAKRLGLHFKGSQSNPQGGVRPPKQKTVDRLTNHGNRFDVTEVIKPRALPKERLAAEIPLAQRKQLLELNESTCRWPYGTPGHVDFFFCGAHPDIGSPYCGFHSRVAYNR